MPAIMLAQAQAALTTWLAAETAVASGHAYQIGNRSMKRADLKMIGDRVTFWNAMVIRLTAVRLRVDEIRTPDVAQELQDEFELAGARVRARGAAAAVDERHPAGVR
jgi:hypothetical protein